MSEKIDWLKVGEQMPPTLGGCADLVHDVRELRLSMEKEVEAIKLRENEITEYIINKMPATDRGAVGLRFRVQVVKKPKPRLTGEGWGIFCSWVRKNDRFDMLQHRLSDKAVMDWQEEQGKAMPGVETILVPTVSVTKI